MSGIGMVILLDTSASVDHFLLGRCSSSLEIFDLCFKIRMGTCLTRYSHVTELNTLILPEFESSML
jgi:hypothetical protein